jgi:hypothetical protein
MAPALFHVGDYKNDTLKDGTKVQFRIIGFNHDQTKDGRILPFTWEMVDCMRYTYPWNDTNTNEGSWPATKLCHRMNDLDGDIYNLMPEEIVELAVPVIKQTADTYNGRCGIIESGHKFWIKSERETFGRSIYSAPGEGHWYEWYRQEDVPWYKERNRVREVTMLRSPHYANGYGFCYVDPNGAANDGVAGDSRGLAPAFSF